MRSFGHQNRIIDAAEWTNSNQYSIEKVRRTRFQLLSGPHTLICIIYSKYLLLLNYIQPAVRIIYCCYYYPGKLSFAYPLRSERTRNKRFSRVQFYNAITRNDVYINI